MSQTPIQAWIAQLESLYREAFSDLSFLENIKGLLTVRVPDQPWTFLRFQLPGQQYLHLHSVELYDRDGVRVAPGDVGLSTSSHQGASLKLLRARKLLDPEHPHNFAFHTRRDEAPWLQLSFAKPIRLDDITIRNRKGGAATRASGIVVSASADGLAWETLYDGGARLRDFHDRAMQLGAEAFPGDEGVCVREMVINVMTCQYEPARKQFSSPAFPAAMKEPVQVALSDVALKQRELEWTSHGARRSFRFWSATEKVEYVELATELVRDLRTLSEDVCLGFGSVLSVVRENDLVKHDDDLDIIVGFPQERARTLSEARRLTKDHLEKLGYKVDGKFFAHWHVKRRGRKVDVFVGLYDEGDRIGWYPGKRGALQREEVFPPATAELLGIKCAIPAKAERYLEVIYGPKWRSPDPGWKHVWDRESYLDIA